MCLGPPARGAQVHPRAPGEFRLCTGKAKQAGKTCVLVKKTVTARVAGVTVTPCQSLSHWQSLCQVLVLTVRATALHGSSSASVIMKGATSVSGREQPASQAARETPLAQATPGQHPSPAAHWQSNS